MKKKKWNKKYRHSQNRISQSSCWTPPDADSGVITLGIYPETNKDIKVTDVKTVRKQIEYLDSLQSDLYHGNSLITLNDIEIVSLPHSNVIDHGNDMQYLFEKLVNNVRILADNGYSLDDVACELMQFLNQYTNIFVNKLRTYSLYEYIIEDRRIRHRNGSSLCNRPPFAVIHYQNKCIKRVEIYCGHDELRRIADFRSEDILFDKCEPFMNEDKGKYVPVNFLISMGLVTETDMPDMNFVLESLHKTMLCDYFDISVKNYESRNVA